MIFFLEAVKDNQSYYKFLLSKEKQLEIIRYLRKYYPLDFKEHFPIGFNLPKESEKLISYLEMDNLHFSFELNQEFEGDTFKLDDLIKKITKKPMRGASPIMGEQIFPYQNLPTFINGFFIYTWHHDLGLFERFNERKESVGFVHPKTHYLIGKNREQTNLYLNNIINFHYEMKGNNKNYVRVITVYSKETKKLQYRILNTEFDASSFGFHSLEPLEGDDFLYLKSYEITPEIAIKYLEWSDFIIDFDFNKHSYFFETLSADEFTLAYDKLLKILNISE